MRFFEFSRAIVITTLILITSPVAAQWAASSFSELSLERAATQGFEPLHSMRWTPNNADSKTFATLEIMEHPEVGVVAILGFEIDAKEQDFPETTADPFDVLICANGTEFCKSLNEIRHEPLFVQCFVDADYAARREFPLECSPENLRFVTVLQVMKHSGFSDLLSQVNPDSARFVLQFMSDAEKQDWPIFDIPVGALPELLNNRDASNAATTLDDDEALIDQLEALQKENEPPAFEGVADVCSQPNLTEFDGSSLSQTYITGQISNLEKCYASTEDLHLSQAEAYLKLHYNIPEGTLASLVAGEDTSLPEACSVDCRTAYMQIFARHSDLQQRYDLAVKGYAEQFELMSETLIKARASINEVFCGNPPSFPHPTIRAKYLKDPAYPPAKDYLQCLIELEQSGYEDVPVVTTDVLEPFEMRAYFDSEGSIRYQAPNGCTECQTMARLVDGFIANALAKARKSFDETQIKHGRYVLANQVFKHLFTQECDVPHVPRTAVGMDDNDRIVFNVTIQQFVQCQNALDRNVYRAMQDFLTKEFPITFDSNTDAFTWKSDCRECPIVGKLFISEYDRSVDNRRRQTNSVMRKIEALNN
jgi:hypothetical protein